MKKENLQKIIEELESDYNKTDAFLMHEYDEDNGWIVANKEALLIYANEFLKAANIVDELDFRENEYHTHRFYQDWFVGPQDAAIAYIELTNRKKADLLAEKNIAEKIEKNWKDRIFEIGCAIMIIGFIGCFFIGVYQVFKFIF